MRRILWPLAIFALSLIAWWSVIYASPLIAEKALLASGKCATGDIVDCKDVLAALGTTGDMFGAVTSLFSGLALFAVAYTLWSDSNSRREARKPLVLLQLDDDSIVLRNPSPAPDVALSFLIDAKAVNKTDEAALNINLVCAISVKGKIVKLEEIGLTQPLTAAGAEDVSFEIRLTGEALNTVLGALTEDSNCAEFLFNAHYNSLENVKWSTEAVYELTCKLGDARRRLNSLRSRTDDFAAQWDNGAAVALNSRVRAGSWKHSRIPN